MRITSDEVIAAIVNDETLKDRFNRYFDKVDINECWIWKGAKKKVTGQEYGITTTKRVNNLKGKMVCTSRLSLFFETHLWPSDMIACHTCDTPSCVNPNHLYWGTDADNSFDKVIRGRVKNKDGAERKPNRRLYKTDEEKLQIKRESIDCNWTKIGEIAERHGMSHGMILAIKYGRTWKDVVL